MPHSVSFRLKKKLINILLDLLSNENLNKNIPIKLYLPIVHNYMLYISTYLAYMVHFIYETKVFPFQQVIQFTLTRFSHNSVTNS